MSAAALLNTLATRGVRLRLEGQRLQIDAPAGSLTAEDRDAIRQHKPQLLEVLRRRPVTLPESVLGIPIEELRREGWDDWPELASTPGMLTAFARSCIATGTLKPRPAPFDDPDADLLGRPASDWVEPCLSPSPADVRRRQENNR